MTEMSIRCPCAPLARLIDACGVGAITTDGDGKMGAGEGVLSKQEQRAITQMLSRNDASHKDIKALTGQVMRASKMQVNLSHMHGFSMADSMETDGRGQAHAGVVASAALLLPPRLTSRLEERCQGACTDIIRHARTHSVGKYQSCMLSGDQRERLA